MLNSLFKGIGGYLGKVIFENMKFGGIKKYFVYKTKYRNEEIRLSVAYLIRINIRGKGYLLVKNSKIPEQFQPVGGVYKYYNQGLEFLREIGFREDDVYKANKNNKNDLRIRIKGVKVSKFIAWFKKKEGRGTNAYREFKEELLDAGILEEKYFNAQDVDFRYQGLDIGDLKFSQHFNCQEILIRDIYEFIPNEKQEKELQKLPKEGRNYRFFSFEEIKRCGRTLDKREYRVGEHTFKILEGEF